MASLAEDLRSIGDDKYREQFLANQMATIRHQQPNLFKLILIIGMTTMCKHHPRIRGLLFVLVVSELCDNPVLQDVFQSLFPGPQSFFDSCPGSLTFGLPFPDNPDQQLSAREVTSSLFLSSSWTEVDGEGAALDDLDIIPSLAFYPTPADVHQTLEWSSSW